MKLKDFYKIVLLGCMLIFCFSSTAFAFSANQPQSPLENNNSHINQSAITKQNLQTNQQNQNLKQAQISADNNIENETMLIIPIMTMLEDGEGTLLFTALMTGIAAGSVGTILIQRACRGKRK